jgi:hypothetical protein
MSLQRSTTGVCHALLRFPEQTIPACSAKVFLHKRPFLHLVVQANHRVWWKIGHKVWCHPHSTEHDTQSIPYLISKQADPYRTCGGTCCPEVSTPKIQPLADLSTTCHDSISHLHHSDHCSNHIIDPHHGQITSRRMEDQTLTKTQAKLNITNDERPVYMDLNS